MRRLALLIGLFSSSSNLFALEKSFYAYTGMSHSGQVDLVLNNAAGSKIAEDTARSTARFNFGVEFNLRSSGPLSVSGMIDATSAKAKNSTNSADTHISFIVMPKAHVGDEIRLWAGLGLGYNVTSFSVTQETIGTSTVVLDDKEIGSFIFAPALGLEFPMSSFLVGIHAMYMSGSATVDGHIDTVNGSQTTTTFFDIDYSKHLWTTVLRVGFSL